MSWILDTNGLGRMSRYVDEAPQPPQLFKRRFMYRAELHRLRGRVAFVLTKGELEFLDCGNEVTYSVTDQISVLAGKGVQIGVARSWTKERTFTSQRCMSCVPILLLTDATYIETGFYGRRGKKLTASVWSLKTEPGCERHYLVDCVPFATCPGCDATEPVRPIDLVEEVAVEEDGGARAITLAIESSKRKIGPNGSPLDESAEWLEEVLDFGEVDEAEGLFISEPWSGLVYLPIELEAAAPGGYPAALVSMGRDVEQLGGVAIEADECLPVVLLASRSESVSAWAGFAERGEGQPEEIVGEQFEFITSELGPFTLLATTVSRTDDSDAPAHDLVINVSDAINGRSRLLRLPVRDTAEDFATTA